MLPMISLIPRLKVCNTDSEKLGMRFSNYQTSDIKCLIRPVQTMHLSKQNTLYGRIQQSKDRSRKEVSNYC